MEELQNTKASFVWEFDNSNEELASAMSGAAELAKVIRRSCSP